MRRTLTRIGLLIGIALVAALPTVAPVSAAPAPTAAAEPDGPGLEPTTVAVPREARDPATPTTPKDQVSQDGVGSAVGGPLASHLDGTCNVYANGTGDLCLWMGYNFTGPRVDFYVGDANLNNNNFIPAVIGVPVGNNTRSGANYDFFWTAWGCRGVNFTGGCGFARPRTWGNITPTYAANVESIFWTL
jgi:hypothetical protein